MPFTFNDRQKSVAFFLLIGFFFALVLLVLVASGSDLVAFKQKHYAYFTDSHGFTGGTAIKFKGFNIGKITDLNLTKDKTIKADLYFYKKYAYLVNEESVLKVQSSLLGSASLILVDHGEGGAPLAKPKSQIFSSDMPEGQALLAKYDLSGKSGDEITDKVKIILDDLHNLKPSIENSLTSLSGTLNNVTGLVYNIREKKEIEQLIELMKSTLVEFKSLAKTVKQAFGGK